MPPAVLMVLGGIQAAIQEWPQIVSIATKAKEFFTGLVKEGVITTDQQNQLHARVDALSAAAQAGQIPPAWTVEADPQ